MDNYQTYSGFNHFFEVRLDLFDGPIDLLLHLVKQRELAIEKVALAEVANQYMLCLEQMRNFDLEVAGEYLVIAATLLSIKSSVLLNEPVELIEDSDGNLFDPHQELLRRLREAEIYKDGAEHLSERSVLGIDVFAPPSSLKRVKAAAVKYKNHDPMLLGKAFQKLLEGTKEEPEMAITMEAVSIVERMMGVLNQLRAIGGSELFYKLVPDLTSRAAIIGTFVALLELCKRQIIAVRQEIETEQIYIDLIAEEVESESLTSEFDQSEDDSDLDETVNA